MTSSRERIVIHTFPGSIFPTTRTYQRRGFSERVEVGVGINLDFYRPRTDDKETRFVQASPLTLLALDLAAEATKPRVYVHEHTPRIRSPQCLAWSIWKAESDEVVFSWPSISASSPIELIERSREWNEAVRELEIDDRWVDRIAFTWIRLHLSWLWKGDEQIPAPLEPDSDIDKAWSQLIQFIERSSNRPSSQWFKAGLPLLTAPEYGLSGEIQRQLFDALFSREFDVWDTLRREAIRESRRCERGQTPEDWIEIYKLPRTQVREIDKTLREMYDTFQYPSWHLIRDRLIKVR